MASKWTKTGAGTASAVIVATVLFLPNWEGTDYVAKRDPIGTGHPLTWCHGQTPADDPTVKPGQRFTAEQCDKYLADSLPKYLQKVDHCVKVPVPIKTMAALLDAAYNAGPAAVCRSPMVAKFNAGDIRGGCNAFAGWYVRSDGQVRKGLIARRSGIGDGRKSERDLCLEGLSEPKASWYAGLDAQQPAQRKPDPVIVKPLTKAEFDIDPYSCFGAGRYEAMSEGRKCAVKKWWQK